jgi:6,7-dimethyl-8-ribityllumazine synthase
MGLAVHGSTYHFAFVAAGFANGDRRREVAVTCDGR